jgi:peroxiredoxin
MKNILLFCFVLLLFATSNIFALQVGNTAPRLDVDKWLKNGPASIIIKTPKDASVKPCRAIIFWGTWNPDLRNNILTLNYLQRRYKAKGLQIIALSREPVKKIEPVIKRFSINYVLGADRGSRTTLQYMGNDQVFPKVFLVNQQRVIIWKGEIVDLAGVLKKLFKGNFDINRQVTINKLHTKLRLALRSFSSENAELIINNILKIAPDDGFAVRAAMFIYDKSNRPTAALKFIEKRIAAVPENMAYRLMKLRLLQQLDPNDLTIINKFAQQTAKDFAQQPRELNEFAWFLMNNFQFTPDIILTALKSAKNAAVQMTTSKDIEQKIIINTTLARAYSIIGNLKQALKLQEQTSLLITNPQDKKQSQKYEKYYRQLIELNKHKII